MNRLIPFLIFISGTTGLWAQGGFSETLKQKVSQSQITSASHTTLFFNQPVYAPGDTAYFSISVWDEVQTKPEAGRRIVDINIWDDQGIATVSSRILVLDGLGKNQLFIPLKVKPGRYRLTASFYQSVLVEYQRDFLVIGDWALKNVNHGIEVETFVEGGHLIEGVANWIAVRLKQPSAEAGTIVKVKTSNGKIINESLVDSYGWTEFQLRPSKETYTLDVAGIVNQLPEVEALGFAMHFRDDRGSNGPSIEIRHGAFLQNPGNFYFVIISRGKLELVTKLSLADTLVQIPIPFRLRDISQCMVIDENYKVWSSRWFSTGGNQNNAKTEVSLNKKEFTTRDRVDAQFLFPENARQISMRVIKKDLFVKYAYDDEIGRQALTSSISRSLLTRTKEPILGASSPAIQQPERFLTIDGQAVFADTGKPLPDSTMLVLFLQNKLFGYETMLQGGLFKVPLVFDVEGDESVFFYASYRKRDQSNMRINLTDTKSVNSILAKPAEQDEIPDPYGQYMTRKKVIDRSFTYFTGPKTESDTDPNSRIIEELGGVDITVEPRNYVAFADMSEVIREILPALEHRTIKDREVIRLYTTHKRPTNYTGPLFVVDGVVTKNAINFLNLKPADVRYIKIVKDYSKLRQLGLLAENGVIIVRTLLGDRSFVQENVFQLQGIAKSRDSKVYSGASLVNARIPDLRPCLYWNPDVSVNDDHRISTSFFTSDDTGEYLIQVSGFTANGEPFMAEKSFNVLVNK